jgi:hypothetical protein
LSWKKDIEARNWTKIKLGASERTRSQAGVCGRQSIASGKNRRCHRQILKMDKYRRFVVITPFEVSGIFKMNSMSFKYGK